MVCEDTSEQPLGLAEAGQVREQSILQLQDEFKSKTIITVLISKLLSTLGILISHKICMKAKLGAVEIAQLVSESM